MKKLFCFIYKRKRTIFHAIATGLGLLLSIHLLKDYGNEKFIITIVATSLILFLEIYLNWRFATKVLRQIDMPSINVYNLWGHLINHITLPLLLFYSVAGFIYFNSDDLVRIISILFLIVINLIFFINVRSYYSDKFKMEEKTRYIYDVIKLIIFFFSINLILHIRMIFQINSWIIGVFVCFISLILYILIIYRKIQVNINTITYVIVVSFVISVLYMILDITGYFFLGINIVIFLLFYIFLSILHHKLERTLTVKVFTEYLLILILALLLFGGLF